MATNRRGAFVLQSNDYGSMLNRSVDTVVRDRVPLVRISG